MKINGVNKKNVISPFQDVRLSRRHNSRESEMFSRRSNMDKLPFSPPTTTKMKTALLHISHILQTPHGFRISNFHKRERKGGGNKSKRHFRNRSREFRQEKINKLNYFPPKNFFLWRMRILKRGKAHHVIFLFLEIISPSFLLRPRETQCCMMISTVHLRRESEPDSTNPPGI